MSDYISEKLYLFIVCPIVFEWINLFPYHPRYTGFIFTDFYILFGGCGFYYSELFY